MVLIASFTSAGRCSGSPRERAQDGFDDVDHGSGLVKEPPRPDLDRTGEGDVVGLPGEDDDGAARAFLPEPAGRLEPVEIGHPKIHQDHVGLVVDRHPHRRHRLGPRPRRR